MLVRNREMLGGMAVSANASRCKVVSSLCPKLIALIKLLTWPMSISWQSYK